MKFNIEQIQKMAKEADVTIITDTDTLTIAHETHNIDRSDKTACFT